MKENKILNSGCISVSPELARQLGMKDKVTAKAQALALGLLAKNKRGITHSQSPVVIKVTYKPKAKKRALPAPRAYRAMPVTLRQRQAAAARAGGESFDKLAAGIMTKIHKISKNYLGGTK